MEILMGTLIRILMGILGGILMEILLGTLIGILIEILMDILIAVFMAYHVFFSPLLFFNQNFVNLQSIAELYIWLSRKVIIDQCSSAKVHTNI